MEKFIDVEAAQNLNKTISSDTVTYTYAKELLDSTPLADVISIKAHNKILIEILTEVKSMMIDPDYEAAVMIQARDNGFNTGIKSCLVLLNKYIDKELQDETKE